MSFVRMSWRVLSKSAGFYALLAGSLIALSLVEAAPAQSPSQPVATTATGAGLSAAPSTGAAPSAAQPTLPNSPSPSGAPTSAIAVHGQYTIEDCLKASLSNNQLLDRQSLELDKARTDVQVAKTNLGPTYSSKLLVRGREQWGATGTGDPNDVANERFRSSLGISYPLYDGGERKTRVNIASMSLSATEMNQASDRDSVSNQTSGAFFATLQGQRLLESAYRQLSQNDENVTDVGERLAVGTVTKGDLLAAESGLSSAKALVSQRQYALDQARSGLALLMAYDGDLSDLQVVEPPEVTFTKPAEDLSSAALARNPHYQYLLTLKSINDQQLRLIRAEESPTLAATAGVGYSDIENPFNTSQQESGLFSYLGFVAVVPVFQTVANRAREHDEKDVIALSALDATDYKLQFVAGIKILQQDYSTAQDGVSSANDAVTSASEAYRLARERYRVGKATEYDVLTSLNLLNAAQDGLVIAEGTRDNVAIDMRVALGQSTTVAPLPSTSNTQAPAQSHDQDTKR